MRTGRKHLKPDQIKEIIELRLLGVKVGSISAKFGYSDDRTIERVLQRHNIKIGRMYSNREGRSYWRKPHGTINQSRTVDGD